MVAPHGTSTCLIPDRFVRQPPWKGEVPAKVGDMSFVIRVRRVSSSLPLVRMYEVEVEGHRERQRRGVAVRRLEKVLGIGDAWSFIDAADRSWSEGSRSWAVEYESVQHEP
jgi:hypothetical protein